VTCAFHARFTFKDSYLPGKWTAFAPKIHLRIQPARLSYYMEGENLENLTGKMVGIGEQALYPLKAAGET
jgi:hypothetical protein